MKFKTYTGITWSLLELEGLLEDEESQVYFEKSKKHFGLHPFHLTNLNASLNEILSSNLNSYDPELKGFLLAYQNPKLLTPLGEIFYDTCFIHIDIQAEFYVFRPKVGCYLKGIINKKGLDHIGILVHKAFNVSIPKPEDQENWLGNDLEIGQEVRFIVTLLDFNSKLPFIRGILNPDNYLQGCRLTGKTLNEKTLHTDSIENNIKNIHSIKQKKQCTFFATDSENSSDADAVQIKKETSKQSKQRQRFDQDDIIEYNEKNEDKRSIKKIKESKLKSFKMEKMQKQHVNNNKSESINEKQIKEEIISEKKNKLNKNSVKRKYSDETDNSVEDFNIDKYIENTGKKTTKKHKTLNIDNNKTLIQIKTEPFNSYSVNEINDKVEESPSKKKHKTHKHFETSELNTSISSSNCDVKEETEKNTIKKKRKKHSRKRLLDISEIKMEPDLKDGIIKIEKPDDNYAHSQLTENFLNDSTESVLKVTSPKKKHKSMLDNVSVIDETDHEVDIKYSKKKNFEDKQSKVQNIKIKKEKTVTDIESDEERINRYNQKDNKMRNSKKSQNKQLNTSEFDISKVKIKIEEFTDS